MPRRLKKEDGKGTLGLLIGNILLLIAIVLLALGPKIANFF